MSRLKGPFDLGNRVHADQRGIQALETAIMLVMFVIVASVLAFAVLTTGLAGAQKTQEVGLESLKDSSASMVLRGSIIGMANAAGTALENLTFTLASGGRAGKAADLSSEGTLVTYVDNEQAKNLESSEWSTTWLIGSGPLLDSGEAVELQVSLSVLDPPLGPQKEFFLRIRPVASSVMLLQRTTPPEFKRIVELSRGFAGPVPVKPTITPIPPTATPVK